MMRVYVFTHIASSDNTNLSRDYVLSLTCEKTEAVQALKKQFYKTLEKSSLTDAEKEAETKKFSQNLLKGKFHYHFRDLHREEQVQYFGKIHTRTVEP